MKRIIVLVWMILFALPVFADVSYTYDKQYEITWAHLDDGRMYPANTNKIKVDNKEFLGFSNYHYYDLSTYNYDKRNDLYTVDIILDRDWTGDLGYYSKSPYNDGTITHLIFTLKYSPKNNYFEPVYKGFITSRACMVGEYMERNYIAVHYDNNTEIIKELDSMYAHLRQSKKTFNYNDGSTYGIEIQYLLKKYI